MTIAWNDVRPTLPQPKLAHDATVNERRVEARFVQVDASPKPHQVTYVLFDGYQLVATWFKAYGAGAGINSAHAAYFAARQYAEIWLAGGELPEQRPAWITKPKKPK